MKHPARPHTVLAALAVACTAPGPGATRDGTGTPAGDSATAASITMHGLTRDVPSDIPLAGAEVTPVEPDAPAVIADADGAWTLVLPPADLARIEVSGDGFASSILWIDPAEGEDPDRPYSHGIGTEAAGEALLGLLGITDVDLRETGMLYVDALDPEWHDYPGARVEIDVPFHSVWRERAPFDFDNEPLTTEDRMDLLFIGVPLGPVRITTTQPDGSPCTGWDEVEVELGSVAYVSRYCPDIAPDVP